MSHPVGEFPAARGLLRGPLVDNDLELVLTAFRPADPLRGWVPAYHFEMRVDGQPAGGVNLRAGNTREIEMYSGHIGYAVEPSFRGRHLAERSCRIVAPLAKAHGLQPVWITCNPDNTASRRTCERLGAVLVETVSISRDHLLWRQGDRQKCRYRWDL